MFYNVQTIIISQKCEVEHFNCTKNIHGNQVDALSYNLSTPYQSNETYDIRRVIERANSTGVTIDAGNETLISDVLVRFVYLEV